MKFCLLGTLHYSLDCEYVSKQSSDELSLSVPTRHRSDLPRHKLFTGFHKLLGTKLANLTAATCLAKMTMIDWTMKRSFHLWILCLSNDRTE